MTTMREPRTVEELWQARSAQHACAKLLGTLELACRAAPEHDRADLERCAQDVQRCARRLARLLGNTTDMTA